MQRGGQENSTPENVDSGANAAPQHEWMYGEVLQKQTKAFIENPKSFLEAQKKIYTSTNIDDSKRTKNLLECLLVAYTTEKHQAEVQKFFSAVHNHAIGSNSQALNNLLYRLCAEEVSENITNVGERLSEIAQGIYCKEENHAAYAFLFSEEIQKRLFATLKAEAL